MTGGKQAIASRSSWLDKQEIRVFVSSTFLDMQAERNELAKTVFPLLRELCHDKGYSFPVRSRKEVLLLGREHNKDQ